MYRISQSDVIYRSLKEPFNEGVLACGFMKKTNASSSQIDFSIDYYSCFVVLSGNGIYRDANNHEIHLNPGDFVQRLPGHIHTTEIVPDGKWIEFFISFGKPVYNYLHDLNLLDIHRLVQKGNIYDIFPKIASFQDLLLQLKESDSKDLYKLLLIAQKLVIEMQGTSILSSGRSRAYTSNQSSHKDSIAYACERLSTKFQENIDYQQLAKSLNMSYENFRKLFKSMTGLSPARYHTEEKMKQAIFMLHSGLTIREVAFLTGYSDVYAFSKQFKKTTATTPGNNKK